jgi:hypothetical protein
MATPYFMIECCIYRAHTGVEGEPGAKRMYSRNEYLYAQNTALQHPTPSGKEFLTRVGAMKPS